MITHPADADVGALLGWGFPAWTGGPLRSSRRSAWRSSYARRSASRRVTERASRLRVASNTRRARPGFLWNCVTAHSCRLNYRRLIFENPSTTPLGDCPSVSSQRDSGRTRSNGGTGARRWLGGRHERGAAGAGGRRGAGGVSSHQLELVEQLCDRVAIIRTGSMVAVGESRTCGRPRPPMVGRRAAVRTGQPALRRARRVDGGVPHRRRGGTRRDATWTRTLRAALAAGPVHEFSLVRPSLTELYRDVVSGRPGRVAAPGGGGMNAPRSLSSGTASA